MANDLDQEIVGNQSGGPTIADYQPDAHVTDDTTVRKWVSYLLLALLAVVIVAAFADLFVINAQPHASNVDDAKADSDRLMSLMNMVFGPVVTLFSSVVGFYFGARTAKESTGKG